MPRTTRESKEAHRRGDGAELLRGYPQISTYEVAVEGELEPPEA